MDITSLTYTSLARLDLQASDREDIHRAARELNALDGITGLLVFNGTHFLQIVEGTREAVEELLDRLRRDPRHTGLEVRDQHRVAQRSFPDWSMELVRVKAGYFDAKDMLKVGFALTVIESLILLLLVPLYWPMIGIG